MLKNQVFIAIDLETSGKYPLAAEICEIALVKFRGGEVLDKWTSLVKPNHQMSDEVIKIHHITNEMVKEAPQIEDVIQEVYDFIGDSPLVGHNLPFDLGFLTWEFERAGLSLLRGAHFCTSLLSIELQPKLISHRLKYLAEKFGLAEEPNHRAEQDAITCMKVFNSLVGEIENLEALRLVQKDDLSMDSFSVLKLKENEKYSDLVKAVAAKSDFKIMYSKGSKKNKWRLVNPRGLVLKTKNESFLVATDPGEIQTKRFILDKIIGSEL